MVHWGSTDQKEITMNHRTLWKVLPVAGLTLAALTGCDNAQEVEESVDQVQQEVEQGVEDVQQGIEQGVEDIQQGDGQGDQDDAQDDQDDDQDG